jgi:antitoxin component of RelBE/YafQ-DinJ toxin-antitoxin module
MKKGTSFKKRSPSRERYERENPTVSARIPKETRLKLLSNLKKLGMTLPDALKLLAGELEIKLIPIDEARQAGYEEAKNQFVVTYQCSVCGKSIELSNPKAKEYASNCMTDRGWGHAECHRRRQQSQH